MGPFSVQFGQIIGNTGTPLTSLYLTRGQKIVAIGVPTLTLGSNGSFTVALDTGYSGRYSFTGVRSVTTANYWDGKYQRWVGKMTGGLVGAKIEGPGPVLWEHMIL